MCRQTVGILTNLNASLRKGPTNSGRMIRVAGEGVKKRIGEVRAFDYTMKRKQESDELHLSLVSLRAWLKWLDYVWDGSALPEVPPPVDFDPMSLV
jgi:hypothetical protein